MRDQGWLVGDIIWFAIRYLIALFLTALVFVAALFISDAISEPWRHVLAPLFRLVVVAAFIVPVTLAGYYGYAAARHARGGANIGFATGITAVAIGVAVQTIGIMMRRMRPSGHVASALDPQHLQDLLLSSMIFGAWVVLAFTIGGYVHGRWPTKRPPVQPAAEPDDRDVLFALGSAWPTKRRPAPQDDDEELDDLDPDWIFRIQLYLKYGRYADETDDRNNTPSAQC